MTNARIFDVTSYGAIGDGDTDDSEPFLRTWEDLCGDDSPDPTMIIPKKTFLIGPVSFHGPCNYHVVHVQLLGNITAPKTFNGWKGCVEKRNWIDFVSVHRLSIHGPGQIDGQGSIWWGNEALHFHRCDGLRLSGTTHINSPNHHIGINGCNNVNVGNLQIFAPERSPNTDGIDISSSSHVNIHDSIIRTGDDCVAINGGTININITRVICGPGHGISIGSLGKNGDYHTVEQNGRGYAKGILFQDIHLVDVKNPIIIDQHYCSQSLDAFCPAPPSMQAVKVSDVTYINVHGTSSNKQAITFNCSGRFKCTKITTNEVRISGENVFAYCNNANGKFLDTNPRVNCE
ncbi:unnamed protein product [Lactuca virosa]|uniref:Polygalacturonase n=1 Tax=Lactuca virosa TaxID=75947 RepID=A0AAU9PQI5_9ASTR|nr:unnamed protein product [Lactuca virosa]